MNPREKARLYHELGQLVRSGTPFARAIEKLAGLTHGAARRALAAISSSLKGGAPVAEALTFGAPFIAPLEAGIFAASERAGRLESGLVHASEYYSAMGEARSRMWIRAAYPLFVLHLAFIALAMPRLIAPDGGVNALILTAGTWIACFWLAGFVAATLIRLILVVAGKSAGLDRLLGWIPLFGKLRRSFALSRFCGAYNLQLDAGVNVITSLSIAGGASASAIFRNAAERALPAIRAGGSVGTALTASRVFPESFVRAFAVGEETGGLDLELRRLADEYRAAAFRQLEIISDWIPKILYLAVAIYIGSKVLGFYRGYFDEARNIGNY